MFSACCCALRPGGSEQWVQAIDPLPHVKSSPSLAPSTADTGLPVLEQDTLETVDLCDAFPRSWSEEPCPEEEEPPPGSVFQVTLHSGHGSLLGLDADVMDCVALAVVGIRGGAVDAWNKLHPQQAIRVNDRITSVNGVRGEACRLLSAFGGHSELWTVRVARPKEIRVTVDRERFPTLGLDLRHTPAGLSLVVHDVLPGPIQRWNEEEAAQAIGVNDRVVEVNGVRGSSGVLLKQCKDLERKQTDLVFLQYGE